MSGPKKIFVKRVFPLLKSIEKRKENGQLTQNHWDDFGRYIENSYLVILVSLPNTRLLIGSFWDRLF